MLGSELIDSARRRIDEPFRHHFKPVDLCDGGRLTVDECMERGMDNAGYDCSSLAIASMCEVLGLATSQWPKNLRHIRQLTRLATDTETRVGDLRLFYSPSDNVHLGLATENAEVVHASGLTKIVEESIVTDPSGAFESIRTVAADALYKAIKS